MVKVMFDGWPKRSAEWMRASEVEGVLDTFPEPRAQ